MCCAIGALLIATIAAWRRWFKTASRWRPYVRWTAGIAAALALGASSVIAAQHVGHYAKRAEINGRSVLAEILAQPICSGDAPGGQGGTQVAAPD